MICCRLTYFNNSFLDSNYQNLIILLIICQIPVTQILLNRITKHFLKLKFYLTNL